jgi:hypothetical protein
VRVRSPRWLRDDQDRNPGSEHRPGYPPPIGEVEILSEGEKRAFDIAVDHLPPSKGFFYAIWLYNSPRSDQPLSKSPPVGSNGRLEGEAPLPANAGDFHRILVTRETNTRPTHPGPVVLSGPFRMGSPPAKAIPRHGPAEDARLTLTPPGGQ